MPRTQLQLTGPEQRWFFAIDALDEGRRLNWHLPESDALPWREVRLPAALTDLIPGATWYEGAAWFRHSFHVPEGWRERQLTLRFEGVNYHCDAWINGTHVASSRDGFLRITGDITAAILPNADNLLIVRVDTTRRRGDVPGRERGWRPYGGILREVCLDVTNALHIAALRVRGDMQGHWQARLQLRNAARTEATVSAAVEISLDGAPVAWETSDDVVLAPGAVADMTVRGTVQEVRRWSPQEPTLYDVTVQLRRPQESGVVDVVEERLGFRSIAARDGRLLLNDAPIFLTGLNRHEDSPAAGMCTDLAQARADLIDMKAMGANFVRLCHYPHHPEELKLCDELGLLAMAEIPLYWWSGHEEVEAGESMYDRKLGSAKRQITRMIERDYNRPSVIFWSVSNENRDELEEVARGNRELIAHARALDPDRLIVHVSDRWTSHPNFQADDVICVNWYPSYWCGGRVADPEYRWEQSAPRWKDELARLHAQYPGKPILVTEFGFAGLRGVTENTLGEDTQAAIIDAEYPGITAHEFVCGATLWCYADHPWPEEPFLNYLNTSPFGVVTRQRRHKPAYWHLRKLFRATHQLPDAPAQPPRVSDDMPVVMTRATLEDIPDAPFAEGYGIRTMRPGEAAVWTDVQRDAEDRIAIGDDLFDSQFGMDVPAQAWRCFFITDRKGSAVGTISAWYDPDPFGHMAGRIHWVAVRQAHRRKGLARSALAYALRQMRKWHDRAFLDTSTSRIGAIKLYLDFGFVPYMQALGAGPAWASVARVLDHPTLKKLEAH